MNICKVALATVCPFTLALIALFSVPLSARSQIYIIPDEPGLIAPSFRGSGNTTFFGWNQGQFFGQPIPPTSSRILDNPVPSFGSVGLVDGVEFFQNDRNDNPFVGIGSGSGNIYTGSGAIGKQAAATLVAPAASGLLDSGFTTIIIQGRTTTAGGFSTLDTLISNYPVFSSINGVTPSFVIAGNAANQGQWWSQYNIPGSAASYTISLTFPGGAGTTPISIAGLSVDTYWSATGYANVSAVPEPSTWGLLLGTSVVAALAALRRRRSGR